MSNTTVYLFIQQIFIEQVQHGRHWGYTSKHSISAPLGLTFWDGDRQSTGRKKVACRGEGDHGPISHPGLGRLHIE